MTKPRYVVTLGGALFAMATLALLSFSGVLPEGSVAFWTWFSVATSALCLYAMKADRAKPFARPATAFLLYNTLLHFGLIVPYALIGPEALRGFGHSVRAIVESSYLIPSICLGNIAMVSFALAVLFNPKGPANTGQKDPDTRFAADRAFAISLLSKLCLAITLLYFGFHVLSGGTALFAPYQFFMRSSAYRSGVYPWVILLYAIGTVCVALLLGSGGHAVDYALWLLIAGFFFLNGNKGEVLYAALAGAGAYGLNGGKIKWPHVLAALFVVFAFLPFITSFRATGAVESLDQIGLDFSGAFVEMGSQIRTTIYTLEDLENNAVQTLFGASYYQPILNIVKSALFFVPFRSNAPATAQMRALHPNAGFNQVAESYLNFGVPGVIAFFAITGWVLTAFENRRLHLLQAAYLGWIATILINASRNHFSFVPGQIAVVSLLYYVSDRFMKRKRPRKVSAFPGAQGRGANMRSKKAFYNTLADMLLEAVSVVCGFIAPRLILAHYGPALHGAVSSIGQFIGYASLLAAGAGGVTKAALYRPVAEKNILKISAIVRATEIFMRKIALLFLTGLVVFAAIYPFAVKNDFGWLFSASLVMILGAGTFAQYFFGNAYKMLLQADQKTYVVSIIQMMAILAYTLLSAVLIRAGLTIHAVRLAAAAVLVLNPLLIHFYVRKKYGIVKDVNPNHLAIKQRWDAFAHQIAEFVYSNSGLVIITLFADSKLASVYAVYAMVVAGMQRVVPLFLGGAEPAFGNMIANNETKTLRKNLGLFEFINFSMTNIFLSCTVALLVPFVSLYTKGVAGVDYHQPVFSFVFCLSSYFFLLRKPYQAVVFAAGHFRQTRNGAIVECALNVFLSVVLFIFFGLPGIALGSLCVMPFRTVQYALYASKRIVFRSRAVFVKRFLISLLNLLLILFAFGFIPSGKSENFVSFLLSAAVHFAVAAAVTAGIAALFYRREIRDMAKKIRNVLTIPDKVF